MSFTGFSGTLGEVAGLAFPPAGVIFTEIGVLLSVAKDVRASHDALVELFERIESFFMRLGVYTQISLTTEMAGVLLKIMTEVLSILSIATKEVKRKRASELFLQDILTPDQSQPVALTRVQKERRSSL
ncbi:hypothetical protein EDB86DRAFT_2261763 [Lactarius hatsudake]|nr:hypothetical protein EDB86DRAFT_2261763 [Lactarius hatsudake]